MTTIFIIISKISLSQKQFEKKLSRFVISKISMFSCSFTSNSLSLKFLNVSLSMIIILNFETLLTTFSFTHSTQKWMKIDLFTNIWRVFQKALVFLLIVEFVSTNSLIMIALTNSNSFFWKSFMFTKLNVQIHLKLLLSMITILFHWLLI